MVTTPVLLRASIETRLVLFVVVAVVSSLVFGSLASTGTITEGRASALITSRYFFLCCDGLGASTAYYSSMIIVVELRFLPRVTYLGSADAF